MVVDVLIESMRVSSSNVSHQPIRDKSASASIYVVHAGSISHSVITEAERVARQDHEIKTVYLGLVTSSPRTNREYNQVLVARELMAMQPSLEHPITVARTGRSRTVCEDRLRMQKEFSHLAVLSYRC